MNALKAIATRLGMSCLIATFIVLPFLFAVHQGATRYLHVSDEPVSELASDSTKTFAERLKIPTPTIKNTSLSGRGWAYCSDTAGDCEIHFGTRFDSDLTSDKARQSVIAHEIGHVLQSIRGERFYSLSDVFLFLVVAAVTAVFTGRRWWSSSFIGGSAVVWGCFLTGESQSDPITFNVLVVFVGIVVCSLFAAAFQLSRERLQRSVWALACTTLIAVAWANARVLDDYQKTLEFEADLIAVCLVGKDARKLSLLAGATHESGGLLHDIYHPSVAERLSAIDQYNAEDCDGLLRGNTLIFNNEWGKQNGSQYDGRDEKG